MTTILIAGAAGNIGRHLVCHLENRYQLRLVDKNVPIDADDRWQRADITNAHELSPMLAGVDGVIHLAIASGFEGDVEDPALNALRFDVNVKGTWNLLAAAAAARVKRFVQTSSLTVVWGYAAPEFVSGDAAPRPVGTYALTKTMAECACEYAARTFGLSTICLRIAKPIDLSDTRWRQRALRPQWIAMPDLLRAYELALTADGITFEIATIVGESSRRRWDLSKAEQILGYQPELRLEDLGYVLGSESEPLT